MALLAHLYAATSKKRYLEAADRFFEFTRRCREDVYCVPPSGKIGWGASLMYALTGDDKYRQVACTVADYLVESQDECGRWGLDMPPSVPEHVYQDITAEFVAWLTEIRQHI